MIHRYIATFVYTARVPIEAEDEYEAEDMATRYLRTDTLTTSRSTT